MLSCTLAIVSVVRKRTWCRKVTGSLSGTAWNFCVSYFCLNNNQLQISNMFLVWCESRTRKRERGKLSGQPLYLCYHSWKRKVMIFISYSRIHLLLIRCGSLGTRECWLPHTARFGHQLKSRRHSAHSRWVRCSPKTWWVWYVLLLCLFLLILDTLQKCASTTPPIYASFEMWHHVWHNVLTQCKFCKHWVWWLGRI